MDNNFRCFIVDPKKMKAIQRLRLAKKVFNNVHREVFHGVTFREFYSVVFVPHTQQTKIKIYIHNKEIIGYSTFQLYKLQKVNLKCYVIMTEVCSKEGAYHIHPIQFFVNEAAKFIFSNPLAKVFMVDTLLSPVIYKKLCHTAYEIYPVYNKKIPVKLVKLSRIVARIFHWNFKSYGNLLIRRINWKVKNKYVIQDSSVDPNKDYFSSLIPDFGIGKGLVIIVPVTLINIIATIIKTFSYGFLRKWLKH